MQLLVSFLAFLVTVGVLVTFHEFGHYWVARRLGVKILRFSVGFGPPLLLRRYGPDNTEFALCWIPLGGYVRMLDEDSPARADEDLSRAFHQRPLWQRTLIMLAGPLFNFLLAMLVWWVVFMHGEIGLRAEIAAVLENTPAAQAGLRAEDRIVSVQGRTTPTWMAVNDALLSGVINGQRVTLEVARRQGTQSVQVNLAAIDIDALQTQGLWRQLGLQPRWPNPSAVIGDVVEGGPAARAGLQSGDQLLAEQGDTPARWQDWVREVRAHPGQPLPVRVRRGVQTLELTVVPEPVWDEQAARQIGRVGASLHPETQRSAQVALQVRHAHPPLAALWWAARETWEKSVLVLDTLFHLFTGRVSVRHIGGPITIADYAGQSAQLGWLAFFGFLAIVSVNLGVLNLLPVPPLDGGRLLYCLAEGLRGKPLSDRVQLGGIQLGVVLLAIFICLALRNDIVRLLSWS